MSKLNKVLSQDREVELGGRTFTVGKMTLNDQAKFDVWINEQVAKEIKSVLKDIGKEDDVDAYMKLKCDADLRLQISSTTSSTLYLIYLLIAKKSKIKYEEFAELLTLDDLGNINKIFGIEEDEIPGSEAEKNVGKK